MSLALSRTVVRRSAKLPFGRTPARFESTATKATEAAKDTASKSAGAAKDTASKASEKAVEYKSKATEGLSKVTSAAGPAISGAAKGVSDALGNVGGRTGKFIAFVQREYLCLRDQLRCLWVISGLNG